MARRRPFNIDVDMPVAASPATAWAVMTDYDRMASFLSNLTSSKVVERRGETLHVAQAGSTKVAFMTGVSGAKENKPQAQLRGCDASFRPPGM